MRILVTGAGGDSGLATIRILKNTGFYVHACDSNKLSSGLHIADSHSIVPLASDKENFLSTIKKIIRRNNIDAIFPNVDEELKVFAEHKEEIGAGVIISPVETIEICQDKIRVLDYLKEDISVPKTNIEDEPFPVIVRPTVSRGSRNVYLAIDETEMIFFRRYIERQGLIPMVQEYLPGKEYTVDALCDFSGSLVVVAPRERLATKGGISSIGKNVKDLRISNIVKKIAEKLRFKGPINIQFKEDKEGILKLIEINPRCSGGLPITYRNGLNIPFLAIKLLENRQISLEELDYQEKTVFRYLDEVI